MVNGSNGNQVGVTNPGLAALASNGGPTQTMALLAGSPALDRGGNANVAAGATDQRGLTRIVNGAVDIGAFELQAPAGPTASAFVVGAKQRRSDVRDGESLLPASGSFRRWASALRIFGYPH